MANKQETDKATRYMKIKTGEFSIGASVSRYCLWDERWPKSGNEFHTMHGYRQSEGALVKSKYAFAIRTCAWHHWRTQGAPGVMVTRYSDVVVCANFQCFWIYSFVWSVAIETSKEWAWCQHAYRNLSRFWPDSWCNARCNLSGVEAGAPDISELQ